MATKGIFRYPVIKTDRNTGNLCIDWKELGVPKSSTLADAAKFQKLFRDGLEYVHYNEQSFRLATMETRLESALSDEDVDIAETTRLQAEIDDLRANLKEYGEKYNTTEEPDAFMKVVIFAATGTRTIGIGKLKTLHEKMVKCEVGNIGKIRDCKKAITTTIDSLFDLRQTDYSKPIHCKLNDNETRDLVMFAQVTTRKWSKNGIVLSKHDEKQVVQQVLLEILRVAFDMTAVKKSKDSVEIMSI